MATAQQIRQKMRLTRRQLSQTQQKYDANLLLQRLISHPVIKAAQKIAITLAHDGEIETQTFINWCWENNKHVYLPVIHPFSKGHLLFLLYEKETKLHKNRYAINEPQLKLHSICPTADLDIIFTPLVAFDKQGNRLGMGGGYYDRLLTPWFKQKKGPYPIGLAHDCQLIEALPIKPWDVPLPEIITPSKHYKNKANSNVEII